MKLVVELERKRWSIVAHPASGDLFTCLGVGERLVSTRWTPEFVYYKQDGNAGQQTFVQRSEVIVVPPQLVDDATLAKYAFDVGLIFGNYREAMRGCMEEARAKLVSKKVLVGCNYAFVVTDVTTTPPTSVFVKQAPDFIKCLGESAKLHKERLLLEVRAYSEWLTLSPSLSPNMPTIFHTDSKNCVVVMEFLGDCELFEHELTTTPLSQPLLTNAASGLGAFLGKIHSKTHVTQLPQAVSDEYAASFKNER